MSAEISLKPAVTDFKEISEEACDRLHECRRQKLQFERQLREGYFFAAPNRARNVLSSVPTSETRPRDESELNTSFVFELTADFPTVMMNTFMPEAQPWAVRKAGMLVPAASRPAVDKQAQDDDKIIFQAIAASNFYQACAMAFRPDLALGTTALWIDVGKSGKPIKCQAVPIRELEINLGPEGDVDDRFIVRWTRNRHVKKLTKGIDLPQKYVDICKKDPNAKTCIIWGYWRDWDQDATETWHHVVMIDKEVIKHVKLAGQGSCPLVVSRFNACPEWAWGEGPLIQALPDIRTYDGIKDAKLKNLDLSINPPIAWPDDSMMNVEEGIETGMAYAVRPGSEGAIKNIYEPNPPDSAIYDMQDMQQTLRRLFFLDWPQQSGDTPPTATQWLDEMTMAQRRIGTPGIGFWVEHCGGSFMRFAYLLTKAGLIKPAEIDGKGIALEAYNPAQKAAEQQDVAQFTRFAQIGGAVAPEEFKIYTDGKATLDNLAKKLGVTEMWAVRPQDQIAGAIAQIQKLQQGTAPTAPAVGGAPGGPPAPPDLGGAAPAPTQVQIRGRL
jgi:hypothetical protein